HTRFSRDWSSDVCSSDLCAIDDEEVEHGRASCKLPAPERQGPVVSQRAELWWDAVLLTLNDLFAQLDRRRVRAIAIDGTSGTLRSEERRVGQGGRASEWM